MGRRGGCFVGNLYVMMLSKVEDVNNWSVVE